MQTKKIALLSVLGFTALLMGVGIWMWNKPHRNVQEEEPAFVGKTDAFSQFVQSANDSVRASLLNQVVELQGQVAEIERSGDSTVALRLLSAEADVLCSFSGKSAVELPNLLPNQAVQLRGIYTGFEAGLPGFDMLPTITLNRCALHQTE
jgi:hypothetical protein